MGGLNRSSKIIMTRFVFTVRVTQIVLNWAHFIFYRSYFSRKGERYCNCLHSLKEAYFNILPQKIFGGTVRLTGTRSRY